MALTKVNTDLLEDGGKLDGIEAGADVTDTANVTAAGALMDSELTSEASVKALNQGVATTDSPTFAGLTASGEITANGGIALGDGDVATFGASDDLQIYHNGSHSFIKDVGTGNLYIDATSLYVRSATGEPYIVGTADAGVSIYHNNALKLATTSTGIDVTGTATMDGLTVDGTAEVSLTDSDYFKINHQTRGGDYRVTTSGISAETLTLRNGASQILTAFANNGDISFYEDTGTTPKFFWDASAESLGIGTSSIAAGTKLQVAGETRIYPDSGTGVLRFGSGGAEKGKLSVDTSSNMMFETGGAERMRISGAEVYVGHTGATAPWAMTGSAFGISLMGSGGFIGAARSGAEPLLLNRTSSDGAIINLRKDGTTVGSIGSRIGTGLTIDSGGTTDGLLKNNGAESFGWNANYFYPRTDNAKDLGLNILRWKDLYLSGAANVGSEVVLADSGTAKFAIGNSGNDFYIYSNAAGSERMRIDSSGNLLVGTTNSSQSAGIGTKIKEWGSVMVVNDSSTGGGDAFSYYSTASNNYKFWVNANGQIAAISTSILSLSDQRFKENIRDLDDGLSKVMQLQPRKFDWKEGEGKNITNDRGFIAQEFEEVFPDLVDEWKDEAPEGEEPYKAVSADLIPTLVKAIQEQQTLIESLTARIAALEE